MNRKELEHILEQLKKDLGISEKIKIKTAPMKTSAGRYSSKTKTIKINEYLVEKLDKECIKYLILHELVHHKLQLKYHTDAFYKEIEKHIDRKKQYDCDKKIISDLLELNKIHY